MDLFHNNYSLINLIGIVILGLAMIWTQWRQGSSRIATEVIDTYKTQVQQLRDELIEEKKGRETDRHDLKNQIQSLALQVERMKGADEEKDKKLKEFTELFQGRNPETEQYMKDMRVFTQGVAQYMKDSAEIFASMKVFMTNLNTATIQNGKKENK
jgi:hypothetical protein